MKKHLLFLGKFFAAIILVVSAAIIYQGHQPYTWKPPAAVQNRETLRVAADMGFSPISFVDKNGNPAGHDVELIYAVGEYLGVNMDVELVQWSEAVSDFQNREYDLLLGVSQLPGRDTWISLSKPYLNDPCVLFGSKSDRFSITDFADSSLGYLASNSSVDEIIEAYDLVPVTYSSYQECFEAMVAGDCDYAIAPTSVGKNILKSMENNAFEIKDISIHNNIFTIGVSTENAELIIQINNALTALNESGELEDIYEYWMVDYVDTKNILSLVAADPKEFILVTLLIFVAFFMFFLLSEYRYGCEMVKQEKEVNRLMAVKNDLALESIHNMQRSTSQLAAIRHDWMKHLSVLAEYCRKEPEMAADYIASLRDELLQIPSISHTANTLVNTILNVQAGKAAEKSIAFRPNVMLPQTLPIPDKDLCVVLINLLDNAIEAAGKGEGTKQVDLQLYVKNNDLVIVIENTLPKDFEMAKFREILSRKDEAEWDQHGHGIPIVRAILKNYCGELLYDVHGDKMVLHTAMELIGEQAPPQAVQKP